MPKRFTIGDMRRLAKRRGGKCLSKEYRSIAHKLRWRCAEGHEWESTAQNVRTQGSWCPRCSPKRLKQEEIDKLAASRGGKCLSGEYRNINSKMRWRCAKGHEWEASVANVKYRGTWCPECGRQRMREAQKARRGKGVRRVVPPDDASGIKDVYVDDNGQIIVM